MQTDKNRNRSISISPVRIGNYGFGETSFSGSETKNINVNSSIKIRDLLKKYNIISVPGSNVKCPFHKNGQEENPSLKIYDDTNTFYCWTCKTGSKPIDFVAKIENISVKAAYYKLLDLLDPNNVVEFNANSESNDIIKKNELLINFSAIILNFKKSYTDSKSIFFIDSLCKKYDSISDNLKYAALVEFNNLMISKIQKHINDLKNGVL